MSNTWTWTKINWETPPEGEYLLFFPPLGEWPSMKIVGWFLGSKEHWDRKPTHFLSIPPDPESA